MYATNQSVVISSTNPSSTLKKMHNYLSCHWTRAAIAAGQAITYEVNWADVFTKAFPPHKYHIMLRKMLVKWKVVMSSRKSMWFRREDMKEQN